MAAGIDTSLGPVGRHSKSHSVGTPTRIIVGGVNVKHAVAAINITRKNNTDRGRRIYRYDKYNPASVIAISDAAPTRLGAMPIMNNPMSGNSVVNVSSSTRR